MISKLIAIAVMISLFLLFLKLLKLGMKVLSFILWLIIVSLLIYLLLPWLDPLLQNFAVHFSAGESCHGLVLISGDCFGLVK